MLQRIGAGPPLLNPQQRPLTWGTHQASRHSNRRHKDFQLVYILRFCVFRCVLCGNSDFAWKKLTLCVFKRLVCQFTRKKKTTEFGGLVNASGPRSTSLQVYTSKTLILPLNRGKKCAEVADVVQELVQGSWGGCESLPGSPCRIDIRQDFLSEYYW